MYIDAFRLTLKENDGIVCESKLFTKGSSDEQQISKQFFILNTNVTKIFVQSSV